MEINKSQIRVPDHRLEIGSLMQRKGTYCEISLPKGNMLQRRAYNITWGVGPGVGVGDEY